MIFSSKNTKLRLNDLDIIANQCSLDIQASIDPRYDAGNRHSRDYFASAGVGSSLTFSHYLTGSLDKIKEFIFDQGEKITNDLVGLNRSNEGTIISGSFGGLTFTSGYLQSYSIDFSPNSPAVASSTIVFFDDLSGEFVQNEETIVKTQVLNCKNISVENFSSNLLGEINDFINCSYSYSVEINPVYKVGSTTPDRIYFGKKNISMGLEVDNPTGYLPYNGISSKFNINLLKYGEPSSAVPTERFSCYGILQGRSVRANVGDKVSHQLSIVTSSPRREAVVSGILSDLRPIYAQNSSLNLTSGEPAYRGPHYV